MKAFLFTHLIILFSVFQLGAQPNSVQLDNPQLTVTSHLQFLQEDNYKPKESAKTLLPGVVSEDAAINIAIKLKQIYDGAGLYIDVDDIPNEANYIDSATNRNKFVINDRYPEIYLVKNKGKWYYSRRTIESIPSIHKRIYPFGTDKLLESLPKMGNAKYFGLHLWQHITLLIIIIIAFIAYQFFSYLLNKILNWALKKANYLYYADKYLIPLAKPVSLLIVFVLLMFMVPVLQLPIKINHYIIITIRASLPFFGTWIAYRAVDILSAYLQKMAEKTENTMDDQLVPLVRKVLKIFVIVVGGLFILDNLEYNINALLAGLSIGGLAVALAAQDTIKNFFGSVMIFLDKPFKVGDWVTSGNIDGTVEEVGFRATRIRTFRNSLIYVPNAKLADSSIDNHGERKYRRFFTTITITYDTPPEKVEAFVEGLRTIIEHHPHTWKDFYNVYFNDLGSHSLNIMLYLFFDVPTWGEELKCRHEILLEILKLVEELEVRFAFPTQRLHIEEFPEKKTMTPEHSISSEQLKEKVAAYFKNKSTTN